MPTKKSYNANQFVLSFDGDPNDAGFIKSIDGGAVVGTAVDESVGPDHVPAAAGDVRSASEYARNVVASPRLRSSSSSWTSKSPTTTASRCPSAS